MPIFGRVGWAMGVIALLACVGACGSRSSETASLAPEGGYPDVVDRRPLIAQVTALRIDRVPGGVIVNARGLPPVQGFWAADLVPETEDERGRPVANNGTMVFQFRAAEPQERPRSGTPASREISAATFLSDQTLIGTSRIGVRAQLNQRSARR